MARNYLLFVVALGSATPVFAQQYLIAGFGYSFAYYHSSDLDRFKNTYNSVNEPYLQFKMKGLKDAVGIRLQVGYRYIGRYHAAVIAGYQKYTSNDAGQFVNTEARNLKLKMHNFIAEIELGPALKKYLLNGVLTFHLQRRVRLESSYSLPGSAEEIRELTGTYTGNSSFSADAGIAVGMVKEPIVLAVKFSYPFITMGEANILTDNRSEKIRTHSTVFPDDYERFILREEYKGIGSNINGWKIMVSLTMLFKLKNEPQKPR